jgi:hypothetical protein
MRPLPGQIRVGVAALMLMWFIVAAHGPVTASAFDDLPRIADVENALNGMEMTLPAAPGTHAVEYWNGVVCEDAATPSPTAAAQADGEHLSGAGNQEDCTYPAAMDAYDQ